MPGGWAVVSMAVMTADSLDKLKIADLAWQTAKQEATNTAEARRAAIREARDGGYSLKELAEILDVSVSAVSDLATDRSTRSKK